MTTTDTPQRGCRSSNVIYTDSYMRLPTPKLKKGKHVFIFVFVHVLCVSFNLQFRCN